MQELFETSNKLIRSVRHDYHRFLYKQIDWEGRLIEIYGPRGVGKTTLMLQKAGELNNRIPGQSLYVTMDDLYFYTHHILEAADGFVKYGGKYLFLDEVHRYPAKYPTHDWSAEIKNIYDKFPELHVVYSGSSVLKLFKGHGDLSRRKIAWHLPGLSFCEFLLFNGVNGLPSLTLDDVLDHHVEAAETILEKVKVFRWFEEYLKNGYYPFYRESPDHYFNRLKDIITVIIENDIPAVTDIPYDTSVKLKKLLAVIAGSVPYTPNLTRIGLDLHVADQRTLLKYLNFLDKAELISILSREGKGRQLLKKPDKLYLDNTNLLYCFTPHPETGMVRETFFLNQTRLDLQVTFPGAGDFLLNGKQLFEIGGKNKDRRKLTRQPEAYLALDGIETGYGRTIPLWMFGFLY